MKSEKFVRSLLKAKASAKLEKEIQEELEEKDPDPEKARAIVRKDIKPDENS